MPPTIYAIAQFGDWTMPLIILTGLTVTQLTISNFIEPWLQGQGLSLSTMAVVVGVVA